MGDHEPADCGPRIDALERRVEDHSSKIEKHGEMHNVSAVKDAESRKDIQSVVVALQTLTVRVEQVLANQGVNLWYEAQKAIIFWAVPICGSAFIWLIIHSGAVK